MAHWLRLNASVKTKTVLGAAGSTLMAMAVTLAIAPASVHAEPELAEANPGYGDVLEIMPESLHLCFSEPVKVGDPSDWKFDVATPEGQSLGIRIVFESAGDCVDVFPGVPDDPPQGIWTFDWLVRAQADGSEGSGSIKFQLGELPPGQTPLVKPASGAMGGGDGGSSTGLLLAIGAGIIVIAIATAGFIFGRRRRH